MKYILKIAETMKRRGREREIRKSNKGDRYDQNILCEYMEIAQRNPPHCTINVCK
jgi:hypothetical protein